MGRGLVNPADDMHDDNPPSHPELLQQLALQFASHGYDIKYLVRAICNSETYQRTSRAANGNEGDTTLFSHAAIKVMSPFQLYDSINLSLTPGIAPPAGPESAQAKKTKSGTRNSFAGFFAPEDGAEVTAYHAGIPQALRLMNSKDQHYGIARAINTLIGQTKTPEEMISRLFLSTLSRRPTAKEMEVMVASAARQTDRKKAYTAILWALLNSTEFIANH
jgi:hypothetical protein